MQKSNHPIKYHLLIIMFLLQGTICAQEPAAGSAPGRPVPDYHHIPYSSEAHNILNIYIAEGTKDGPPTPLYVWAHAGGGNLDGFGHQLWNELSPAGISAISWGSIDSAETAEEYGQKSIADFEKVMAFIIENANTYNLDISKIVVGGSSRGSFITWGFSHKNPELVKGIYSTGALGDPAMWRDDLRYLTKLDPRDYIHAGSPPVLFAYPATLGDVNIHNPRSGILIKERYEELGIGNLSRVEHSLTKRDLHRWSFIADFILEITGKKDKSADAINSIKIGNQVWMAENLNVSHFRNGDPIQQVKNNAEWEDAGARGQPAWCYYNNDPVMGEKYGKLYNLDAINDPRGLAPEGWSIPTEAQWKELSDFLGGENMAGLKMKSTTSWNADGSGNNESGFTGLPGGNRNSDGSFWFEGEYGYWWSRTSVGRQPGAIARIRVINNYSDNLRGDGGYRLSGLSVRCIKK
jgi:uncharacterized protein (TIGR02145 family)